MSDYKPITGELRNGGWRLLSTVVGDEQYVQKFDADKFDQLCDAIDAIHAQLERENAALKAELDRVRGEWDDWESSLIELPRDADKLPIHVGDMLAGEKAGGFGLCEPFEVGCIMFGRDIIRVNDVHGLTRCVEFAHHYVPDTWERIIEDAIGEGMARQRNNDSGECCERANPMNNDAFVVRCKKLAGDAS